MGYYSRERKDLKSCPFCGGEAIIKYDNRINKGVGVTSGRIFCTNCGCGTPELVTPIVDFNKNEFEDMLVNHWNQRD